MPVFVCQNKAVHTLSFGITEKSHFEEMKGIFPVVWEKTEKKIQHRLEDFLNDDPYSAYEGLELENDPSGINIPEMLSLRKLWKCYDMSEFGKYRYKAFEDKGHWFPGKKAFKENVNKIDLSKVPSNIPLKEMLKEAHKEFYKPEFKMMKVKAKVKKIIHSIIVKN